MAKTHHHHPVVDAVGARVEICRLAIARGADAALIGRVLHELGDEVRTARAGRLPLKAAPIAVRVSTRAHGRRRRA